MPRLHGAKVLSGLGRAAAFTRDATVPRSPRPQRREGRVGQYLEDQIPEIVSEYLPLIFLGDLEGNLEAGNKCFVRTQQWDERRVGKKSSLVAFMHGSDDLDAFKPLCPGKKKRFGRHH